LDGRAPDDGRGGEECRGHRRRRWTEPAPPREEPEEAGAHRGQERRERVHAKRQGRDGDRCGEPAEERPDRVAGGMRDAERFRGEGEFPRVARADGARERGAVKDRGDRRGREACPCSGPSHVAFSARCGPSPRWWNEVGAVAPTSPTAETVARPCANQYDEYADTLIFTIPVAAVYCQPPVLSTPAVVFTAFELLMGSFGTRPSAKMVPSSTGNVAAPFRAFRAYWMAIEERIDPSWPFTVATRACSRMSSYFGIATAARMPRITMTMTNSISVNPLSVFFRYIRETSLASKCEMPPPPPGAGLIAASEGVDRSMAVHS